MQISAGASATANLDPARAKELMQKAQDLEASFLSEMLSYTGLDAQKGDFTGGIGEDQFGSFLRDAQAKAIVQHGGIGLAQTIFTALARRENVGQ